MESDNEPKKILICYAHDQNNVAYGFRSVEQRDIFLKQSPNSASIAAKDVWENTKSVWIITYTDNSLHVMERMIRENGKTKIMSSK